MQPKPSKVWFHFSISGSRGFRLTLSFSPQSSATGDPPLLYEAHSLGEAWRQLTEDANRSRARAGEPPEDLFLKDIDIDADLLVPYARRHLKEAAVQQARALGILREDG